MELTNGVFDRFERIEQKSERTKLVISRHWNNPEIQITVDEKRIVLFADLDDFIVALISEIDKPITFSKAALADKIASASRKAVEKIKQSTNQVM
jgi:hypothetical protein